MTVNLKILIDKQKTNFSVIMTFYVLLADYRQSIANSRDYQGLLSREIRSAYNLIATEYGKKAFANSYVQRHTKTNDFFLEDQSRYKIRPELLEGLVLDKVDEILKMIKFNFQKYIQERLEVIRSIENLKESEFDEDSLKKALSALLTKDGFNKGQLFEIISFSILREYFSTFGFTLNRFSTTFSNDGGIDFIAQDCVYQVTHAPTVKKIETDLRKLPEIKRVIVLPKLSESIRKILVESELVKGVITSEDLMNHFLPRLLNMEISKRLFETIIFELNREI